VEQLGWLNSVGKEAAMADIMQVLGEADFTKLVEQEIPSGKVGATAPIKGFNDVKIGVDNFFKNTMEAIKDQQELINNGNPRLNKKPLTPKEQTQLEHLKEVLGEALPGSGAKPTTVKLFDEFTGRSGKPT
ncbi:MAG: hypothetical protein LBU73_09590, partial [Helicobacteraceae bacterium]|nr:hypothetical protein [Helicobacteraceae bacterium]